MATAEGQLDKVPETPTDKLSQVLTRFVDECQRIVETTGDEVTELHAEARRVADAAHDEANGMRESVADKINELRSLEAALEVFYHAIGH